MDTPTTSAHAAHVPARLQAAWAELVHRLGVSNFEKNYIFGILMKNCTTYQSAIKIRDVAGTPTLPCQRASSAHAAHVPALARQGGLYDQKIKKG